MKTIVDVGTTKDCRGTNEARRKAAYRLRRGIREMLHRVGADLPSDTGLWRLRFVETETSVQAVLTVEGDDYSDGPLDAPYIPHGTIEDGVHRIQSMLQASWRPRRYPRLRNILRKED